MCVEITKFILFLECIGKSLFSIIFSITQSLENFIAERFEVTADIVEKETKFGFLRYYRSKESLEHLCHITKITLKNQFIDYFKNKDYFSLLQSFDLLGEFMYGITDILTFFIELCII